MVHKASLLSIQEVTVDPILRKNFLEQVLTMANQEHNLECTDMVGKFYSF